MDSRVPNSNRAPIRCSQINLRHSNAAHSFHMKGLAASAQTWITFIQEPYCPFGKVPGVPANANLLKVDSKERARAILLTSKDIPALKLTQFTDRDTAAAVLEYTIDGRPEHIVLASVYMPYDSPDPPPSENVRKLVDFCREKRWKLIIGTDANAHHTHWGSTDVNDRGSYLFEFLHETDLMVCNVGNVPTFVTEQREQVIDITLASYELLNKVKEWKVQTEETSHSDHRLITFELHMSTPVVAVEFRNVRKTKWSEYREKLQQCVPGVPEAEMTSIEVIEDFADRLETAINTAYHTSCRMVKIAKKHKSHFWSEELSQLHREVNRLTRQHRRNPSAENLQRLREARRRFKTEMRRAKRESWKSFCASIDTLPAAARLHKILKRDQFSTSGTMKKPNGSFTESAEETLDLLLAAHFPREEAPSETEGEDHQILSSNLHSEMVTEKKIEAAFSDFGKYKAAGPDGIYPVLIQEGMEILKSPIAALYRACLNTGYVPKCWQKSRVIFLPKPGKDDYSNPKSFRPISLTSFLLKGLERLIHWSLVDQLGDGIFHKKQFAYRAGVSTVDALHHLVARLEGAVLNKEVAIAVFLDIEGAFSNARTRSMIEAIRRKGVTESIVRWVSYMLKHRTVQTTQMGKTRTAPATVGCPQGGILSPILWNLVVDSLLNLAGELPGVHIQAFADDVTPVASGIDPLIVGQTVQESLRRLESWAQEHHLMFSASKTVPVMFTRRRVACPALSLGGIPLEYQQTMKQLGVTLDAKLSWIPHVKMVTRKASICLAQCRRAMGPTWGLKPKTMLWIYKSLVRPIMEYAAPIWLPGLDLKTASKMLEKVQRAGLMAVTGAYPSTPTAGLEALLNIPPLPLFLRASATKAIYRMRTRGNWLGKGRHMGSRKSHIDRGNETQEELEISEFPSDSLRINARNIDPPYRVHIPPRNEVQPVQLGEDTADEILCFTDGSKTEQGTGCGFTIQGEAILLEESTPLGKYPTVFQSEVVAIANAATALLRQEVVGKNITVYSDSQAALKALSSRTIRGKLVSECVDRLTSLCTQNSVTLKWIPGHQGHAGNERADALARQGSASQAIGPEPLLPISLALAKTQVDETVQREFISHWRNTDGCRQTKQFCTVPSIKKAQGLLALSRKDLRNTIQIMSGHNTLARHQFLGRKMPSPLCPCCQSTVAEETGAHHLAECNTFGFHRLQILGSLHLSPESYGTIKPQRIARFTKTTKRLEILGVPC